MKLWFAGTATPLLYYIGIEANRVAAKKRILELFSETRAESLVTEIQIRLEQN